MKTLLLIFAASLPLFVCSTAPVHTQGRGQGRGAAVTLPDGAGKDVVQAQCTKCHALGLIANSGGNTRQGWEDLIGTMVLLPGDQKSQAGLVSREQFSRAASSAGRRSSRTGEGVDQGMDGPIARLPAARS
jgi:hypothetical protein